MTKSESSFDGAFVIRHSSFVIHPMVAEEFQLPTSRVAFWQAYEPAVKCDLSCCAVRTSRGLVFIDPIPLAEEALEELLQLAPPTAIVCTNGNHARAAADFRARFSIPILAHPDAALEIDQTISDGETIPGGFTVITLPGAGAGEIGLHSAEGTMHVGDALTNIEPRGLALLPEKYCSDARELRRSLGKLLRFEFEILTFAHGLPLVANARRRLEELLA